MAAFFTLISKELKLLWRDRAALLLLFLMPVVLVMVITLVQRNVLKIAGESGARVIVVDHDRRGLGAELIREAAGLGIGANLAVGDVDVPDLVRRCRLGEIQAVVEIPAGFDQSLEGSVNDSLKEGGVGGGGSPPMLTAVFDPTALTGLRAAVIGVIRAVGGRLETRKTMAAIKRILPDRIRAALVATMGPAAAMASITMPELAGPAGGMVVIRAENAGTGPIVPSAVQHNVPAWSLFGIFFIVVPLAAVILDERSSNTFARLLVAPVSRFSLVSSRIAAYTMACILQFVVLFAIGAWVLPRFGTDPLVLPPAILALGLTLFCACFAASGYGFMVGILARTHEQAAMFGAISVVVAAAIGGVMVPVYAMPPLMRSLSVVSPLGWGLEALVALFVRGVGFAEIWPALLRLFLFGTVCLLFSWWKIFRLKLARS